MTLDELIMKPQTNVIEQPEKNECQEMNQWESDQEMRDDQDRDLCNLSKALVTKNSRQK